MARNSELPHNTESAVRELDTERLSGLLANDSIQRGACVFPRHSDPRSDDSASTHLPDCTLDLKISLTRSGGRTNVDYRDAHSNRLLEIDVIDLDRDYKASWTYTRVGNKDVPTSVYLDYPHRDAWVTLDPHTHKPTNITLRLYEDGYYLDGKYRADQSGNMVRDSLVRHANARTY